MSTQQQPPTPLNPSQQLPTYKEYRYNAHQHSSTTPLAVFHLECALRDQQQQEQQGQQKIETSTANGPKAYHEWWTGVQSQYVGNATTNKKSPSKQQQQQQPPPPQPKGDSAFSSANLVVVDRLTISKPTSAAAALNSSVGLLGSSVTELPSANNTNNSIGNSSFGEINNNNSNNNNVGVPASLSFSIKVPLTSTATASAANLEQSWNGVLHEWAGLTRQIVSVATTTTTTSPSTTPTNSGSNQPSPTNNNNNNAAANRRSPPLLKSDGGNSPSKDNSNNNMTGDQVLFHEIRKMSVERSFSSNTKADEESKNNTNTANKSENLPPLSALIHLLTEVNLTPSINADRSSLLKLRDALLAIVSKEFPPSVTVNQTKPIIEYTEEGKSVDEKTFLAPKQHLMANASSPSSGATPKVQIEGVASDNSGGGGGGGSAARRHSRGNSTPSIAGANSSSNLNVPMNKLHERTTSEVSESGSIYEHQQQQQQRTNSGLAIGTSPSNSAGKHHLRQSSINNIEGTTTTTAAPSSGGYTHNPYAHHQRQSSSSISPNHEIANLQAQDGSGGTGATSPPSLHQNTTMPHISPSSSQSHFQQPQQPQQSQAPAPPPPPGYANNNNNNQQQQQHMRNYSGGSGYQQQQHHHHNHQYSGSGYQQQQQQQQNYHQRQLSAGFSSNNINTSSNNNMNHQRMASSPPPPGYSDACHQGQLVQGPGGHHTPSSALANSSLGGGLSITIGKTAKQIQNENILKQREHQRHISGGNMSLEFPAGGGGGSNNVSPSHQQQQQQQYQHHGRTVSGSNNNGIIQPFVQTIYNGIATGGGAGGNSPPNNNNNNNNTSLDSLPPVSSSMMTQPHQQDGSSNINNERTHHRRTSSHLANAFGTMGGGGDQQQQQQLQHLRQPSMEMLNSNSSLERTSPAIQAGKSPMNTSGGGAPPRKSNLANAFGGGGK